MRAVVVGAGVAGAAAAIALRRIGWQVTVYEAYQDPAGPYGSFVSLAVNGLRGLAALGCLPAVQQAGFPVDRQRMWSAGGRLLGDVPRGRRADDPLTSVTLNRSDLVSTLRQAALASGAEIVTGHRVAAADLAAADADLLVGADGIWSAARPWIDPAAPKPRYAGLYTASGVSDLGSAIGDAGFEPGTFNMTFGRQGAFIHLPAPDGTVWWSAQVSAAVAPQPAEITLHVLQALVGADELPGRILRMARAGISTTLIHVLDPVPVQAGRRTVLIGDAAHPVGAGQGAAMAIEDAVILARQLGGLLDSDVSHSDNSVGATTAGARVDQAITAFVGLRGDRLGKLAKSAARNRDAKTAGPLAARLRDVVMPVTFNRFYEKATGWLYDFDPGMLPGPGARQGLSGRGIPADTGSGAD
ncbi:MAG: FAD-dependent monooxygenase [Nakamurella sp.]